MKVRDGAGNESGEATDSITFDNSVAQPSVSIDEGAVTAQNTINLTLSADNDVNGMKLWLNTQSIPSDFSAFPVANTMADFELFPAGSPPADSTVYTVYLVVRDDAGNVSSPSAQAQITYDSDSPDISLDINSGTTASASSLLSVTATASTLSGEVTGMKFWITSAGNPTLETEPADWDLVSGSPVPKTYTRTLTDQDTYTIHVKARNTAEVVGTVTGTYIYDATAPVSTSAVIVVNDEETETWTNSAAGKVSLRISDVTDNSAVSEMKVWYEDGVGGSSKSFAEWEDYSATVSDFALENSDGSYTVHALFRDPAGNISDEVVSETVHLDRVAPSVSLTIGTT